MKITIEFNTDNAAFVDNGLPSELYEILKDAERWICEHAAGDAGRLKDTNGNTVGTVELCL